MPSWFIVFLVSTSGAIALAIYCIALLLPPRPIVIRLERPAPPSQVLRTPPHVPPPLNAALLRRRSASGGPSPAARRFPLDEDELEVTVPQAYARYEVVER